MFYIRIHKYEGSENAYSRGPTVLSLRERYDSSFVVRSLLPSNACLLTAFRPFSRHAQQFHPSRMAFHFHFITKGSNPIESDQSAPTPFLRSVRIVKYNATNPAQTTPSHQSVC